MDDINGYKFRVDDNDTISVQLAEGVFTPTGTSDLLFRAAKSEEGGFKF